jgi:small-conductance mechanosensitive channel
MIIVPNSYAVNHTIVNWNYIRGFIAFNDIHVMVSYKEDPMKVKEIFERVLDSSPYVLKNPKPIVRLHEFGPNGYEFLLRGFISSNYTLDQWDIASGIRLQIVKIFKQQNIEFALPIRLMVNYPPTYLKEQVPVPLDINPDDIVE